MPIPVTVVLSLLSQLIQPSPPSQPSQPPAPVHSATGTPAPPAANTTPEPTPITVAAPARSTPTADAPSERPRRRLRVGGFVALGLGGGLLGVMAGAVATHRATLKQLGAQEAALAPGRSVSRFTRDEVQWNLEQARFDRNLAIGAGVSGAVSLALAATLFALARARDPSRRRLALAPMWLPAGAALHLQVRLP